MKKLLIILGLLGAAGVAHATTQGKDANQHVMNNVYGLGAAFNEAYTGTQSNLHEPFDTDTQAVQVVCTTACYIAAEATPATATSADTLLPANVIMRLKVNTGISIRAVQVSSGGTLSITQLR